MISNLSAVSKALEQAVKEHTDLAVVGVSGGIDSSVVACICVAALGKENVYLVSMPYDQCDCATFNARSEELAELLGGHHYSVEVGKACDEVEEQIKTVFPKQELDKLTPANIRPRLRMSILYAISGELGYKTNKRVRVMGTGHLSEDLIGYDTKGGDALCDIFILSDLLKSEVYQLAQHYKVPKSIQDATPSAGLYPGQSDAEELGYSYDELEAPTLALFELINKGYKPEQIEATLDEFSTLDLERVNFVVSRYKMHYHKHQAPVTIPIRRKEWFE